MAAVNRQSTAARVKSGQSHHKSKLTDAEVTLLRTMHAQDGMGYSALATTFGLSKSCVAQICRNERRVGAA